MDEFKCSCTLKFNLIFRFRYLLPSCHRFEDLLQKGISVFEQKFHSAPELAGVAPGRVNLIGEHTDYNEGFVFPMALPMVAIVLGKRNDDCICRILTTNERADDPKYVEFPVPTDSDSLKPGKPSWANYIKGIVQYFDGPKVGFDGVVISSVPLGSGLSSSAALEVATYTFLEGLVGHKTDTKQKALLCQKAEHIFALVPCGLMDQLISIHGEECCATLIDCRSLDIVNVSIPASTSVFLIINSNVHHELASSEYSIRRQTCEEVAKKLKRKSLRDVTLAELNKTYFQVKMSEYRIFTGSANSTGKIISSLDCLELNSSDAIDDKMYRRAKHVITENERTMQAVKALKSKSLPEFGNLMNESHDSLSKDYEVSCEELDFLVKTAREINGVYGSRMTGGGFGGCTVTLVEKSSVNDVIKKINDTYKKQADFFVVVPSSGARVVSLT